MALPINTTVFLAEFETKVLLARESRGPGTYRTKLMIRCNSLLSSIFIESADVGATVEAKYWDTTTGDETTPERFDLLSHDVYGAANAGETHRILVTKIHNKPQLEVIVTGGNVKFGVYGTAVSSSASDIDSALVREGTAFVQESSRAIPVACYDEEGDKLHFIRCKEGALSTNDDVGDPFFMEDRKSSVIGSFIDIFSFTVPVGIRRRIKKVNVSTKNSGVWEVLSDSNIIASGRISQANPNSEFKFDPIRPIGAGVVVKLRFCASAQQPVVDVDGYLSASDVISV